MDSAFPASSQMLAALQSNMVSAQSATVQTLKGKALLEFNRVECRAKEIDHGGQRSLSKLVHFHDRVIENSFSRFAYYKD